jgi:protein tyrosine phosphatase (PTP) superfamily phosphohydrolase (DUF442 family)
MSPSPRCAPGALILLVAAAALTGFSCAGAAPLATPPSPTVQVQKSEWPGLENSAKVSEDLYRGAQPTKEGFRQLKQMGIKTVINLCYLGTDRDDMKGLGLYYCEIPSVPWNPTDAHMAAFLRVMRERKHLPAFVHCQHGADRTGAAVAVYRIVVQGWSKKDAIGEMDPFGFHSAWSVLKDYVSKLDVAGLDRMAKAAEMPKVVLVP